MPEYRSDRGKWIPVDKAAKEECAELGVEFRGTEAKAGNSGVATTPTNPKVATSKTDGQLIAEPTPAQKKRGKKKGA